MGGRLLAVAALLVISLAGCSRLPLRADPVVAPTDEALSAACLVGSVAPDRGMAAPRYR